MRGDSLPFPGNDGDGDRHSGDDGQESAGHAAGPSFPVPAAAGRDVYYAGRDIYVNAGVAAPGPIGRPARERACRDAITGLVHASPDILLQVTSAPPPVEMAVLRSGDLARGPVPAAQLARAGRDCWLIGGPGAGKSRLLAEWTLRLGRGPDSGPGAPLPLLVRAADLLACADSRSGDDREPTLMLADAVNMALRGVGRSELPWLEEFLNSQISAGPPCLLLVDGFDEVPDARDRNHLLRRLKETSAMAWCGQVVVASRPTGGTETAWTGTEQPQARDAGPRWPDERYELLGLGEAQQAEFLRGWFTKLDVESPGPSAELLTGEISQKGLGELARQPLMLVILGQLFLHERTGSLPGSPAEAYAELVSRVFDAFRAQAGGAADDVRRDLLNRFAGADGLVSRLALARLQGEAGNAVEWFTAQTEDLRMRAGVKPQHWSLLITEFTLRIPLLVARGDDYDFVHPTFYEYLAARLVADDPRARRRWTGPVLRQVRADGPGRQLALLTRYLESPGSFPSSPFADWLCTFWSDRPPFTRRLLRLLRRDPGNTCAAVAGLARRGVPVAPAVTDAVRRRLSAELAASRSATVRGQPSRRAGDRAREYTTALIVAASYLALLGDPAGPGALAQAATGPASGELRITAARHLSALGDGRGRELIAAAVTAAISAPVDPELTGQSPYYDTEMMRRRQIALDFTRTGHPAAASVLRIFLTDDLFDAKTRGYVYGMLTEDAYGDVHCADAAATLLAEFPAEDSADETYGREQALGRIVMMTDPGSADRLAVLSAAGTLPTRQRLKAAFALAELGDQRAADPIARLLGEEMNPWERYAVTWALAEIGDMRAVAGLVPFAAASPPDAYGPLWRQPTASAAAKGHPSALEVLLALAAALPMGPKLQVLLGLAETGDPRARDLAATVSPDAPADVAVLFSLADALARQADPRFTQPLKRWTVGASTTDAAKAWAAAVLADPAPVLGEGLYTAMIRARDLPLPVRASALQDMLDQEHPQSTPVLLASLPELMADPGGTVPREFRDAAIDHLTGHGRPEAVPYLVERFRDTGRPDSDREQALRALVGIDGNAATTALVEIAPGLTEFGPPRDGRYLVSERLTRLGHEQAVEVMAGWVDQHQAQGWHGPDWLRERLAELSPPHAAALIDERVTRALDGAPFQSPARWPDVAPPYWTKQIGRLAQLGPPGADVLARWAQDGTFTARDRLNALRTLYALGDHRAAALRDELLADSSLSRAARRRVRAAFRTRGDAAN